MPAFPNKFPGTCANCCGHVPAQQGVCEKGPNGWLVRHTTPCQRTQAQVQPRQADVGDLSNILALFNRVEGHLKAPAIVAGIPKLAADGEWLRDEKGQLVWSAISFRVNVAGDRAKVPGSLTVLHAERGENGREWFGRILRDGTFQASRVGQAVPGLAKRLGEFAAAPAKVAGEDGRLHGRCCFCRIALKDERSTVVGYGPTCAARYGLPWGEDETDLKAA